MNSTNKENPGHQRLTMQPLATLLLGDPGRAGDCAAYDCHPIAAWSVTMTVMGLVNGKVVLRNPRLPELEPVELDALADSGAVHLCIPEQVRIQLKLEAIDSKEVMLADGRRAVVPHVGPIEIRFK